MEIRSHMRKFSLCMRSLYAEHAVGTNEAAAVKFRKLRDDTRNDAMVYLKTVLPVSMKVVSGISEYLGNCEVLSFEQWSDDLEDIIEATEAYKQACEVLLEMHNDILVPMKKREDEAKIILIEFTDRVKEYNKKKAIAKGAEAKVQELVVSDVMIPALKHIIDGLSASATFFSVMTQELHNFESRCHRGLKEPKRHQYVIMKKYVVKIKALCREFYAGFPSVMTDFEAIPTEGTDENYVDRWMKKQLKEIRKKYNLTKMFNDMMSEVHKETEGAEYITRFKRQLKDMPIIMRLFSLCMRSLYAQNAVGTNAATAAKFRKLRDDTRDDAMVYLKTVLPLSMTVVSGINEYFENYEFLSFEQWSEDLEDIIEETEAYKQACDLLLQMHEDILVPLKKREDEANTIFEELTGLMEEYDKKKAEFARSATVKHKWAIGLCWIPIVNIIAIPLLCTSADQDFMKAIAKGAQANVQEAAALVVSNTMIPALKLMIEGLSGAAAFFIVMTKELRTFKRRGKRTLDDPKKRYYNLMKGEAVQIKYLSREFYAVLPSVRTDFKAIPTEGTDENYVDRWMKKQLKEIKKKGTLTKMVIDMLKETFPQLSTQAIMSA